MEDLEMVINNYTANGDDSAVRHVTFGPASGKVAILVEIDPDAEVMEVTLGNGPEDADIPTELSAMLGVLSRLVSQLDAMPEFWAAIEARQ